MLLLFYFIVVFAVDEMDGGDTGDDPDNDMDEFDRLRSIREQHRRAKYLQKLMARSVSAQQVSIFDTYLYK